MGVDFVLFKFSPRMNERYGEWDSNPQPLFNCFFLRVHSKGNLSVSALAPFEFVRAASARGLGHFGFNCFASVRCDPTEDIG